MKNKKKELAIREYSDGSFEADLFVDGLLEGDTIGPFDSENEIYAAANSYLAGLDQVTLVSEKTVELQ